MSELAARLQHHFATREQQYEASTFGMWVFLVTEIMFFGGLFTTYIIYRTAYPEVFIHASHHLDVTLGTINTGVLIGSSLTMALAIHGAKTDDKKALVRNLILTMILGGVFLCIKAFEYHHKWVDGLYPGNFWYSGPQAPQQKLFFSLYFGMTGLRALHMVIGEVCMAVVLVLSLRDNYSSKYFTPVECMGLYWHFVDLVWIFLFPLLYLLGRHG